MTGEVVYLYAYDIAYEADLAAIENGLRGKAERFRLGRAKDAPRKILGYHPLTLHTEDMQLEGPLGPMKLSVSIKLFSVGAVSVNVRVPVECGQLAELVGFRNLRFSDNATLEDRVRGVVERLLTAVTPQLDTPVAALEPPEVYTIFCLHPLRGGGEAAGAAGPPTPTDEWLRRHQREVAALLDGETDAARLSDQEVQETMKYKYSYYREDLAVLDWDAALVIDMPEAYRDTLYVLEVANLQLEELKVYDAKLDRVLDQAYDDVEAVARPHAFRTRRQVLTDLREIHMDLTKVADELANITKFIGDWHLSRIYMGCAARFHLAEWEGVVSQKLQAMDNLYTMLQQESMNRAMLMLEVAVVALFIIDVVIIVVLGIK